MIDTHQMDVDGYPHAARPPRQENDLFSWLPLYDLPIRSF